jgi:predicted transposase/invertase (TIGR01784 family)
MSKTLDPMLDVVFKLMFTRAGTEPMLLSLLNAVLRPSQPIVSVTILNPDLDKKDVSDRGVVLDLRLRLLDGSQINVEMQMGRRSGMRERSLYHWARMYSSQLVKGNEYTALARCVTVFLLAYNELPSGRFHAKFVLREAHDDEVFTDQLELHLVQLRQLAGLGPQEVEQEGALVGWGRFFVAQDEQEREALAMTDPNLAKAKEVLDELSADPATRRLAADREEALLLYHFEINEARRAGREEGLEKGQRALLLRLAHTRFGELPSDVARRVETATTEQVTRWGERLMTAESLDAWFAAMEDGE